MPAPSLSEIAKHLGISKSRAKQLKDSGMPTNTLRAAKLFREAQAKRRAPVNAKTANLQKKKKGRPRNPPKLSKTGDPLTDMLRNAMGRAEAAHNAYADAVIQESTNQSVLLSNSTKAADAVIKMERMVREEQERRKILVPRQEIVESCRKAINAMLSRLKKIPGETGPQLVGKEPLHIVAILQRSVDEVLLAGNRAMNEI